MCSLKKNQLAVGLMALVLQPSSAAFSGASTSRAAVHGVPLTVAYRAPTMPSCSRRSTHAVMLAADDAERQSKRAAVDMRLFEESVECDAECVAEAMHVEDCLVRTRHCVPTFQQTVIKRPSTVLSKLSLDPPLL